MKNIKEKTALASIILKVCLTVLKFVGFFFTGSLAILAEAWHSFTDILTSVLVYFSVIPKQEDILTSESRVNGTEEDNPTGGNFLRKWITIFLRMPYEYKTSFAIGLFLLFISIGLFKKAIFFTPFQIQNALITGIIFIIFSLFSYVVYKFETGVGIKEKSAALVSDGMHSKADMLSSLLAGFSLIVYHMGINVDRPVALLIAFFVFSFSIEVIVNTVASHIKQKEYSFRYKSLEIINFVFRTEPWIRLATYIDGTFKLGLKKSNFFKVILRHLRAIFVFLIAIPFLLTCFYTIKPSQEAIIERFGKPLSKKGPIQAGLHCKLPWPIEKVVKVDSKVIQKINIGNVSDKNTFALLWTRKHGTEESFLSGDNNFFYPYFVAHYRVKDIFKFTYQHRDSRDLLNNVAHRIISNIFARKAFYQIVTTYRKQLERQMLESIQRELDMLESGLEIVALNIKDVHPPIFIAESFEDVIAAYQDKERMINEAIGYRNSSLPDARAEVEKKIRGAEAYVTDKIDRAEGEGSRFRAQVGSCRINRKVTFRKFYLEGLTETMTDNRKIIIDPASGVPEVWLDFDKMLSTVGDKKMEITR